ncbi:tetratricopeptide repeat protein [Pyxidicoccus parkwayensis]|uniref:Tetratricopeptide repeat protein n=1 Tax=Pyxidicoccus parkwayensis TaxID=2813578 RepID=A0ABX7P6W9_9BACT|nr:tetratricopeptide repeat protein [Pyxidicoccus parkwaysis]QSQ26201.1 tetratricopeptide repeat protein [Pyxidicoccus parkwaysis]
MAGTTKSEKIRQRELRAPDSFQKVGVEASDWLAQRQKTIGIAAGVLILGGLGVGIANEISKSGEEKASQALGQALTVLERPVEGVEPPQPGETEPAFKSLKERDEALVTALTDFRKAHSGTHSATTAALSLGKAQFRLGNYPAAQEAFGAFLKDAPANEPLRAGAFEGEGYAFEAQQKFDDAIKSFDQMDASGGGEYLVGMGAYHKARMLILQGKKEEAAQVLSKISTDHPNTAAARQASERLAVLASEGVKVPAPAAPAAAATGQDAG